MPVRRRREGLAARDDPHRAGVKSFDKPCCTTQGGTTLPLEKKDLDASTILHQAHRQGAAFRLYKKQGDGFQAAGIWRRSRKDESQVARREAPRPAGTTR